ncbi:MULTISPECIES: 16S rRNA (uracil(1498)-N(3))-methyltransferase [Campylobacter]|uniref:16S rRNA (uracil(1498)-N(3))-methyltransferase n=1 Tax=Campylobacter TaxID=194 RepID=UPI000A345C12|nr:MULTISPECIES: 16S rRNA (uracil(1498)-N(3))-methyltransferase [unclassified Campylobacter]MCR8679145.1 16S rRNA (uracil(1498)-N(3))-methyltransferase [Campylobacter sp. RM19072]MCR8696029.1 16S rRNA (uracil(1498)-N(3))-methyltransferase [Campylobacter sp. RM19073]
MKFIYHKGAGSENLKIDGDGFSHLKALRLSEGKRVDIRNLKDGYSYIYEISTIDRHVATLLLIFKSLILPMEHKFELAWAVVDSSVIEKSLPSLNELGVGRLNLVYCEFSQRNIKLNLERFERILISSSQQCGRNSLMEISIFHSVDELLGYKKDIALIDFGGKNLDNYKMDYMLFVGPEGGFSQSEREKITMKFALNSPYILRSNTAIISVASRFLI